MESEVETSYLPDWYAPALGGAAVAVAAGLMWRSTRGSSTRTRLSGHRGTNVEESVAVNRPAAELYAFWHDLKQLPKVMPELSSVQMVGPRLSHWVAKAPTGWRMEWDAEIINDIQDELIAWRTVDGASLVSAGSVHFEEHSHGRGTVVRIKLQYDPPGGKIAAMFARAIGQSPSQVIREGLRRFKQLIETGEIPTTEGQPRGGR